MIIIETEINHTNNMKLGCGRLDIRNYIRGVLDFYFSCLLRKRAKLDDVGDLTHRKRYARVQHYSMIVLPSDCQL